MSPATPGDASLAVVGTDTGVGKTVVTAGITSWLRQEGVDALAVKPCQTGYPEDDDAAFVRSVCGDDGGPAGAGGDEAPGASDDEASPLDGPDADDAAVCFRTLSPPLAPTVAAEREGVDLSYEALRSECRAAMDRREAVVLEGIGGVCVPLADDREVIDLVADLGLPALVVARSGLGTLNHTALTVEALRARDVPVRGVVLNRYEGASVAERTNPDVVAERNGLPVATLAAAEDGTAAARSIPERLPRWVLDG